MQFIIWQIFVVTNVFMKYKTDLHKLILVFTQCTTYQCFIYYVYAVISQRHLIVSLKAFNKKRDKKLRWKDFDDDSTVLLQDLCTWFFWCVWTLIIMMWANMHFWYFWSIRFQENVKCFSVFCLYLKQLGLRRKYIWGGENF